MADDNRGRRKAKGTPVSRRPAPDGEALLRSVAAKPPKATKRKRAKKPG